MTRRRAAADLPTAGGVARLLAVLLALAVGFAAAPLALVPAAEVSVTEETDADAETESAACPRRANPATAPPPVPAPAVRLVTGGSRSAVPFPPGPVGRGPFRPHPRC